MQGKVFIASDLLVRHKLKEEDSASGFMAASNMDETWKNP